MTALPLPAPDFDVAIPCWQCPDCKTVQTDGIDLCPFCGPRPRPFLFGQEPSKEAERVLFIRVRGPEG